MKALERYPRIITLRDGERVTFRPMVQGDADRLWDFFRVIPEHDRMYFREDVDRKEVVDRWAAELDYDTVLPLLALEGDRIVGDTTLHRQRTGWKRTVGTIRIQIAPDYRHRGLGTAMIREIRYLGEKAGLRHLLAEVVEEQHAAVLALERLGFERAAVLRNFVSDPRGGYHNLVVLLYPMTDSDLAAGY